MAHQFRSRILLFSAVLALASSRGAFAYIPPSYYIVKTVAQKRAGVKGVRIRSSIIALQDGKPVGARLKEIATYDYATRLLRSRISDDSGRELYGVDRKLHAEGSESLFGERVDEILLASHGESLIKTLVSAGIPVRSEAALQALATDEERIDAERTGMQRLNGTVAWILGGGKPSAPTSTQPLATSQLWIEKDTFLPLRFIAPVNGNGSEGSAEATFQNYRFFHEFPFPRLIEVSRGGAQQFRVELTEVQVNPELAELKKQAPSGFTDAGNSAETPIRDLIRKYVELAR